MLIAPCQHFPSITDSTSDPGVMSEALGDILRQRQISTLLQPVVDLKQRRILGYEALSRGPSDSHLHNPTALFDTAFRSGQLSTLELLCRETALKHFQHLGLPGALFLNATPMSLFQASHAAHHTLALLEKVGLSPEQVVIELTEQHPLEDFALVREAIRHFHELGFRIALDDLGGGYAGLRMWSELQPDYVKIDKHFVQSIHEDPVKQGFVRSILDIARDLNCQVIAEGIETVEEYQCIRSLGIGIGQGYYFARPHTLPPVSLPPKLFDQSTGGQRGTRLGESVSCLMRESPQVAPETRVETVVELFSNSPGLLSLPVVRADGVTLGMVRRYQVLDVYASNFGRALHGKKPVVALMEAEPVVVEQDMSMEQVSQLVTDNMQLRLDEEFIITNQGRFAGIGRVVDLLRKITELQVRSARYANPLTLLPGNVPIYERLDQLLENNESFAVAYCDLDHFKPFNDAYGYSQGDQVIQKLAELLTAAVHPEDDFVGHVGGDDFILIFTSRNWRERCERVLEQFHRAVRYFYRPDDLARGGIQGKDRSGKHIFHPLLSLSIGVVSPHPGSCSSHHDVAAMASEAKAQAKQQDGDALFIDRRRIPPRYQEIAARTPFRNR
ncbi:GGDEF domain-containing protein [Haliea atlantica]